MSIDGTPSPSQDAGTAAHDGDRQPEQAAAQQASAADASSRPRSDSPSREEYADAVRESGPPIPQARGGFDDHAATGRKDHGAERPADHEPVELDARQTRRAGMQAEPGERERAEPEDASRSPAGDRTDAAASAVTHFHGEFKGRPIDHYTDGTRWSAPDQVRGENVVGISPGVPDLPPTGEELVESAGEESPRLERLRREMYRESDDLLDGLEKNANLTSDIFSRPPTSSYQTTPADRPYISEAQHSGIDAGTVATAAFVVGVLIDRGVSSLVQHYKEHARRE